MKKRLKLTIATAVAVLALTPAAFYPKEASASTVAPTGFYTVDSYTTPIQFRNFGLTKKQELLAKEDLALVVNGLVYFAKDALGKSDAELSKIAITEADFEAIYGELTESGYTQASYDFKVLSIE